MKIADNFIPGGKVYETRIPKFGVKKLLDYCKLFEISPTKYFYHQKANKKYELPGTVVLDLFRKTIEKLHAESNGEFPLEIVNAFSFSGLPNEDPIFAGDDLIFKAQIRVIDNTSHQKKVEAQIQIYRNNKIVFGGLFKLIHRK